MDLSKLSFEELLKALAEANESNKLLAWDPYPWQREFHDMGAVKKERLLMCANGVGKSETISAETAIHATGQYPPWWKGYRFEKGGWEIWIGSIDNDMQKVAMQKKLLGPDLEDGLGTGFIPKDAIVKVERRQAGIKDVADEVVVKHAGGGRVKLKFKTYEQGWRKWQSGDPKIIVWDEEPDENNVEQKDIHSEVITRLVRNNGIFIGGYTPLIGETALTRHFMESEDPAIWWTGASWDDAPHMTEENRQRALASYKEHEKDSRTKGIPMMGEGRIFTASENEIAIDPVPIPDHWARITGIDFGLAHPAALACLAWDRDTDIIYLYDSWKKENVKTNEHADVINARGDWIPVAWPHDGEKRDPRSGLQFHKIYRNDHHVNMLSRSARYKNDQGGAQAQWPIIEEMRLRMDVGKFKVFRTCKDWLSEFRSYHTKDGQIVSRRDDCLKASFYALMMRRYAVSRMEGARYEYQRPSMAAFTTAVH